jgi:hypothetical protein
MTERLIIVNLSDKLEDLPLVRDAKRFIRPDLALISREADRWYEQEGFEEIPITRDMLNPKLGLHVISRPEVPKDFIDRINYQEILRKSSDEGSAGKDAGIEIINAGFDASKLDVLVNMLASVVKKVTG